MCTNFFRINYPNQELDHGVHWQGIKLSSVSSLRLGRGTLSLFMPYQGPTTKEIDDIERDADDPTYTVQGEKDAGHELKVGFIGGHCGI